MSTASKWHPTGRECIEYAAKAARLDGAWSDALGAWLVPYKGDENIGLGTHHMHWNPMLNPAQALKLAATVCIDLEFTADEAIARMLDIRVSYPCTGEGAGARLAAACQAITECAARFAGEPI